jgi:SAM-dependent methyltransferase
MADEIFEHPRLAAIYDALDDDRTDLLPYLAIAQELGAHHVIDNGCGTGTFALLMAARGMTVTGVDPARASLDVARAKTGADRVTWIHGDARDLPARHGDLVTMTGNVAQAITDPADWDATLRGARKALRRGGHLVFETRDPAFGGWREWNRNDSYRCVEIAGVGTVENWSDVTDITWPLVTFRTTWVFHSDGAVLTSDSTLRFRERAEIETALPAHGFTVTDVRQAPDRPGREFVFVAQAVSVFHPPQPQW